MNYFVLCIYLFASFSIFAVNNPKDRRKAKIPIQSMTQFNEPFLPPVMCMTEFSDKSLPRVISMDSLSDDIQLPRRLTQAEKESLKILNDWEGL
jgi:hypothetical protein